LGQLTSTSAALSEGSCKAMNSPVWPCWVYGVGVEPALQQALDDGGVVLFDGLEEIFVRACVCRRKPSNDKKINYLLKVMDEVFHGMISPR
jgi:hypothetical protein